jgi:outer membrane protein OmpA-like peptidoglycan-associated protein
MSACLAVFFSLFLLSASLFGQDDATPQYDLFVGYQWLHPGANVPSPLGTPSSPIPQVIPDMSKGLGAALTYNFNRYAGLEADFGHNWDNYETTLSAGPRLMFRDENAAFFVHALLSYNRLGIDGLTASNGVGGILGGGLDVKLTHLITWRVAEADFVGAFQHYSDYSTVPGIGHPGLQGVRLRTGVLFNFGYPELKAVGATVSVQPSEVMVGQPVTATASATNFNPNHKLNYEWSNSCGKINGTDTSATIDTIGVPGGSCTVTVHVMDPKGHKNNEATATTTYTVKEPPKNPPSASCSVNPSSAEVGATVNVSCTCTSPDGVPVTVSGFTASSGTINGSGNSATLNTTGAQAGTVTVNATCSDQRGLSTPITVSLDLRNPPPPPPQVSPEVRQLEARLSLHGVYFATAQPTVANPNGGLVLSQQRTLTSLAEDFKKYLNSKPDAHLILQGHADKRGSATYNQALSERRVNSTKNFLVQHGVPEANIETKAFGAEQNLTADQVKASVEQDNELTQGERERILSHERVIILASNRRVDITLNTTGQESVRQFPFNAEDSLTLIGGREKPAAKTTKPAAKKKKQ